MSSAVFDRRLGENEVINFNAGNHSISVSMQYKEYVRVERPELGTFAEEEPLPMKLERRLFPHCRSIAAGLAVAVGLMVFISSLRGGQEVRAVKPSDCMPAVTDYAYMWWANGWRSPAKVLAFQTGHYGMAIDVRKVQVLHLGAIAKPLPAEQAVVQGNEAIFSLPPRPVGLEVIVDGTSYTCTGSEAPASRLIDSGRFLQRADIEQLVFQDAAGRRLPAAGRLEIVAWPDRLCLLLEITPSQRLPNASLRIRHDGAAPDSVTGREFLKGQTQTTTALLWSSETPAQSPQVVEAREIKTDNAISVAYDASRHCHVVRLPEKAWYEGPKADRLDRIAVRLKNTSARPQVFRLLFNSDNPAHITGLTPMIRDPQGQPTGIPVQISKNWHRREGGELLYQGPWLHAITCVRVPAAAVLNVELTIAHGWWGTLPAVSHAQLCLIGWGTDQIWDESAIGSWGESICYDPDVNLQRGMIDDVRPLMVTGMNGGQWTWTHNVGGGDFADYDPDNKGRRFLKRMRTWYRQTGPCLTGVTYAGISPDEAFSVRATVSSPRCDDIVRAYYHVRYDFHKAVAPERLELFRLGADRYNDPDASQIAYGQGAQVVRTFPATGKDGCQQTFSLAGAGTWVALYRAAGQPAEGGWANRGMILRAWSARVGGRDGAEPVGAIIGTSQGRHASANLITGSKSFQPGDFVEFTVEMVILPARAADYYGPNENLRTHLAHSGDDWQAVARQAAGNSLEVKCLTGSLERSYPPVVRVGPDQSASIEISGGLAQLPVSFTGLADYKGYSLWIVRDGTSTRLDQSAHGNDYWQTDYDPSTGAWRQTYNVPLDTPGDTRRTVILRFARIGALPDKIQGTDQGAAVSFVSEMAPLPHIACAQPPGPTPHVYKTMGQCQIKADVYQTASGNRKPAVIVKHAPAPAIAA